MENQRKSSGDNIAMKVIGGIGGFLAAGAVAIGAVKLIDAITDNNNAKNEERYSEEAVQRRMQVVRQRQFMRQQQEEYRLYEERQRQEENRQMGVWAESNNWNRNGFAFNNNNNQNNQNRQNHQNRQYNHQRNNNNNNQRNINNQQQMNLQHQQQFQNRIRQRQYPQNHHNQNRRNPRAGLVDSVLVPTYQPPQPQPQRNQPPRLRPDFSDVENETNEAINSSSIDCDDPTYCCPITREFMVDPYLLTSCGHSFEKYGIYNWLKHNQKCPVCNRVARICDLIPNFGMKTILEKKREELKKIEEKK